MKRLFTVTFEGSLVVHAENRDEAERIAEKHRRDVMADISMSSVYETGRCLPEGWEDECVPYGEDDLSIKDIWAAEPRQCAAKVKP